MSGCRLSSAIREARIAFGNDLTGMGTDSGVPRGGVWGVQTPPEIPKISVESSIA